MRALELLTGVQGPGGVRQRVPECGLPFPADPRYIV